MRGPALTVHVLGEITMLRRVLLLTLISFGLAAPLNGQHPQPFEQPPTAPELIASIEADLDKLATAPEGEKDDLLWSIKQSLRTLREYGPDAFESVPLLVEILQESREQAKAVKKDEALTFARPVWSLERLCLSTLEAIGPDAASSIPILIEYLDDEELVRISTDIGWITATFLASEALSKIGPPAVEPLTSALDHESERTRYHAQWALLELGPAAKAAVPRLREALTSDREYMVRQHAAWTIAEIGCFTDETVAALIAALDDREYVVRYAAAQTLGRVRPAREDVIAALLAALGDEEVKVRVRAVRSLGEQGPGAAEAVPVLIDLLASEEVYREGHPGTGIALRRDAAEALGKIGPDAKPAIPALMKIVREPRELKDSWLAVPPYRAQDAAINAMVELAPANPQVNAFLLKIARSGRRAWPQEKAVWALGQIGPPAATPALRALQEEMEELARHRFSRGAGTSEDDRLRGLAAAVLRLAPTDKEAFGLATDSIKRNVRNRYYVFDGDEGELLADALAGSTQWRISALRREILGLIDRYLAAPPEDENVHFYVRDVRIPRLMVRLDQDGQIVAPILLKRLRGTPSDDSLREMIVEALGEIPCGDQRDLLKMLRSSEASLRVEAVTALGSSPNVRSEIVATLSDASVRVRLAALRALAKLGLDAKLAPSEVERLLDDESLAVRFAAQKVLQRNESSVPVITPGNSAPGYKNLGPP
jgi:HEAT repeat protein